jgi:NAD(P)-dependent dehydrogenase (short-subunit alcohol dehydrogenase family)
VQIVGRLEKKVAVITGGCSGIGLATVELFVAEGATVVVADINAEHGELLVEKYPQAVRFAYCDVSVEKNIVAAIELAVSEFGGLDVTFNNAGIMGPPESFEFMSTEGWDRTMNINARGVMFGVKHSIAPMRARGGGAIVNTASVSGVSTNGPTAYSISKAATIQLTKLAALELASSNIRVNAILPGIIKTPIFGSFVGLTRDDAKKMADIFAGHASALQPLAQTGLPNDIAQACLYLASDAAAFVTGAELCVDGGLAVMAPTNTDANIVGSVGDIFGKIVNEIRDEE